MALLEERHNGLANLEKFISKTKARKLEKSIYKYCVAKHRIQKLPNEYLPDVYIGKLNDICFNLDIKNNNYLLPRILTDRIPISIVTSLTFAELLPSKWKTIIEKREYSENREEENDESNYPCKKCESKKTFLFQLQTRSADEPMTTFIQCKNCGYKMRK